MFATSCDDRFLPPGLNDIYFSFAELSAENIENRDFRIRLREHKSPITVMAIHGGYIEYGSSLIADELAGKNLNFYAFEGIKPKDNRFLHITSRRFDEPQALDLAHRSQIVVSIHGYNQTARRVTCIGGGNKRVGARIAKNLRMAGFSVEFPCRLYPALQSTNIVNKGRQAGVQIELSKPLRSRLIERPNLRESYVHAIQNALLNN